ncbi:MAG: T9SS type A sorting domain-containing protein [Ignavibacteriae bacterium]|nr:T9SS type A sorting domain-containing protein [Ignavibacteriota bacterium]
MKKFILLLLIISATALTAQDYQYFTAKQGIPKAMEIAKAYYNSDSVELYEIVCVRIIDFLGYGEGIDEDYDPYNDSTGKSLFWYYKFCINNDSCLSIRIKNNNEFISDTMLRTELKYYERPLKIDSIFIDSDSLVSIYKNCHFIYPRRLVFFRLINLDSDYPFKTCHFENSNVWYYRGSEWMWYVLIEYFISGVNGDCCDLYVDVPEKNKTNSTFDIQSNPNSDNITIKLNTDLYQNAELSLYNQVGVLAFADKINSNNYHLNTYSYPSGIYLLQIKYGGNIMTKKVVIVH